MASFVLNDESVMTSHGFMLLNKGGRFERFRANPVMLDAHESCEVIGRWLNLRVEGTCLIADTEFDMEDPEAVKISGKVERGFIKGASMGIHINDAELMNVPGKGYVPVITDWELMEASPVGVPSNAGSLKLYESDGKTLMLAEEVKLSIDTIITQKQKMDKITLSAEAAKVLGTSKEPDATELNAAVMELSAKAKAATTAKEKAEGELAQHKKAQAKGLVELAVKDGRITADKRESFEKLAESDYKQAEDLLNSIPKKESLSSQTKNGAGSAKNREGWNYLKWLKEDPKGLAEMENNDPEGFKELKASYRSA